MTRNLRVKNGAFGIAAGLLSMLLVFAGSAAAQDSNDVETRRAGSTFLGDTGLWFVPTGEILPHRKYSISVQRANFDRQEGITDVSHYAATSET